MRNKFLVMAAMFVCTLGFCIQASAQSINGNIVGTVTDQQSAAIVGASVTVTNMETGNTRTAETNSEGIYRVSGLPVGIYSVKIGASGFATGTENTKVSAGTDTAVDFKLSAGSLSAQVDVSAGTGELLQTTQSQVVKTVESARITELPGRNTLTGLALLNPGVLPNQNGRPGSGFVVNGNRSRSNNFTIDGANNNDQSLSIPRQNLPPGAIQEFQIITNTFAAEYGRNAGSYVNQITRSGTNEFHGNAFYNWDGNGVDSLTTNQQRCVNSNRAAFPNDTNTQVLRRCRSVTNDTIYGFTLGGPIKKGHTFFFHSLDLNPFQTLVTSASRAALDSTSRAFLQTNRTQFASPAAVDFILATFPVANDPTPAGGTLAGSTITTRRADGTAVGNVTLLTLNRTLTGPISYGTRFWRVMEKVNTKISSKDQLSFRFLMDKSTDPGAPASLPGLEIGQLLKNKSFTINDVYVISSNVINEARFTYSTRDLLFPENLDKFVSGAQLSVGGSLSAFNGGNANFPQFRNDKVYEWTDNVGVTTGNHAMKFGYNLLRYNLNSFFAPNSKGFVSYASLNDLLNDASNLIQKTNGDFTTPSITYEHGIFAQDDWRINQSLTLNLGLRYEYVSTPLGFFSNAKSDTNNFGPRVGFAWNPKNIMDGRFVLRSGFAIAYDQVFQNILLNVSRNFPRAITNSIACTGCQPFRGVSNIADPAAQSFLNTSPSNFTGNPKTLDYRYFAFNEKVKQPMSQQWTVSLQLALGKDYVAKAEYIGTKGSNLVREFESNYGFCGAFNALSKFKTSCTSVNVNNERIDPTRGSVLLGQGFAKSIYHSGQFTLEKRLSNIEMFGTSFGSANFSAHYTWSTFISESDDVLGGQTNRTIASDPRNLGSDRARSGFDQPHRFGMSGIWNSPEVFRNNKILNRIFSGFELAPVITLAMGTPYSILASTNELGIVPSVISTVQLSQRVGLLNPNRQDNSFTIATLSSAGVLAVPDPTARYVLWPNFAGVAGSLGANTQRTGGTQNVNLTVAKNFKTFESHRFQIRAEIFNLFNHRNFTAIPTNTLSASTNPLTFLDLGQTNVSGRSFLFGANYVF